MAQKAIGQLSVRFTVAPTGGSRTPRCENSKVAAAEGKGLAVTLQGCAACFLKCILSFLPFPIFKALVLPPYKPLFCPSLSLINCEEIYCFQ